MNKKIIIMLLTLFISTITLDLFSMDLEPDLRTFARRGDMARVKELVQENGADVSEIHEDWDTTALHSAICLSLREKEKGRAMVKYLLQHGAQESVCVRDQRSLTPLHMALKTWKSETDIDLLQMLLESGRPSKELLVELICDRAKDPAIACLLRYLLKTRPSS